MRDLQLYLIFCFCVRFGAELTFTSHISSCNQTQTGLSQTCVNNRYQQNVMYADSVCLCIKMVERKDERENLNHISHEV